MHKYNLDYITNFIQSEISVSLVLHKKIDLGDEVISDVLLKTCFHKAIS